MNRDRLRCDRDFWRRRRSRTACVYHDEPATPLCVPLASLMVDLGGRVSVDANDEQPAAACTGSAR